MKQKHDNFLLTAIFFILIFTLFQSQVNGQTSAVPVGDTEAEKWREDLRFMAEQMPKVHKNLFHSMTREQFETAVKKLDERIPMLARHQIIVEMMRIVAMVGEGDGHTSLSPYFNPKIGFHYYPLELYLFKDGLFVQAADSKYANIVGARIIKIGNVSAEEAFKKVSEVISHDNTTTFKDRVPSFIVIPEVLQALGITDDMEEAQFVVEKDGKQIIAKIKPAGKLAQRSHDEEVADPTKNWSKMNGGSNNPIPLWLKSPDDNYGFEYLEDSKTVYVQYNKIFIKKDEPMTTFANRLFDFVKTHDVQNFILDVRMNYGGNSFYNMPLLLGIIKSEKINRRGHLFTIIGRRTFSAAQNLVNELERYTNTIFVGEPTGGKVNFYGDHELIPLPNSGITVAVSTLWWQTNPKDSRPWIAPSILTELSSEDYQSNIDPAVTAVLNYKSIAEVLEPVLSANNIELAVKEYRDFKASPKTSPINTESEINTLGYRLMNANQLNQAIEIFKLNVESYPHSSNAFDSLGDAYAKGGNREFAISSYQRALELNPKNEATAKKLEDLKHK